MHWAYKIANQLIEKYPNKETYVCASGISPSGSVHIGNFREIITTYFVVKALNNLGKKTRFIFSWDDFDRFRKVPNNIDPTFHHFIGKAYSNIPDPFGCHSTFAEHFEKEFEHSLSELGIEVEFIYQSQEYKSGRYNVDIIHALEKRKEIYDILIKFKTSVPNERERNDFYPITLYCESCKKDDTTITRYNEELKILDYQCKCGFSNQLSVEVANNIKLNWKIDWAMRWMKEDVVFEPGGRDHSSETGSYNVSKEIAKAIFDYDAPHYTPYEFIGIKGQNQKMSSSSGNLITPAELLEIYLPEVILFMFAKYKPTAAFNIGLDEDVIKNYSEFERYQSNYIDKSLQDLDICQSVEFAHFGIINKKHPKFNHVASILPLVNYNVDLLQDIFVHNGENYSAKEIEKISQMAEYWIKNYYPQKNIIVNDKQAIEFYHSLTEEQQYWLKNLCDYLLNNKHQDQTELMTELYSICYHDDKKVMKANQKTFFTMIYQLVLNRTSGPPIPLLFQAVNKIQLINLLNFNEG
ncbi:lysyl-tRNA synthetase [Bacillus sp. FJAT-25509]|uniref:lysine--tRNA ligase n=1 Tax=Bacillaceae TaxID=186817 RepID=UPI0006F5DDD8|nr:lysine--tRNA ligase [Bacillus sp. FJAT-25509]KQL42105.1 lysyl-tRNA synthetase [Bacillus sp. FJAT-25509]